MFDYFKIGSDLVRVNAALIRGEPLPTLITDEETDRILSKRIEEEDIPPRLLADIESEVNDG